MSSKVIAGQPIPEVTIPRLGGGEMTIGTPLCDYTWHMIVVYRGKHCPRCHAYLAKLQTLLPRLYALGMGVIAVSGDPEVRAQAMVDELGLTIPVGYAMTLPQMAKLGLYISSPRSPDETDQPFAEPGLFVINAEGNVQLIEIGNASFLRVDPLALVEGIEGLFKRKFPVRGTLQV